MRESCVPSTPPPQGRFATPHKLRRSIQYSLWFPFFYYGDGWSRWGGGGDVSGCNEFSNSCAFMCYSAGVLSRPLKWNTNNLALKTATVIRQLREKKCPYLGKSLLFVAFYFHLWKNSYWSSPKEYNAARFALSDLQTVFAYQDVFSIV